MCKGNGMYRINMSDPKNLLFCLKWPWDRPKKETSLLFISLKFWFLCLQFCELNFKATLCLNNSRPFQLLHVGLHLNPKTRKLSPNEEQRALVLNLQATKRQRLIYVHPSASCNSLLPFVLQMVHRNKDSLNFVMANVEWMR